ncbi:MAG TPA: thioredoxin domain-containing protein [Polyangiales bacterium]|nr:thioredoxin domain-containing protein [Polyangiales bacterium]
MPKPAAQVPAATQESGPAKFPLSERKELSGDVERIYELARSADAPSLGGADAKVTLEICSDFQCPYCAQLAPTVHELHENYEELLRIVWRNCPLPFHEHALPAAEASLEVQKQGGSKAFWAYHDLLFAHQHELSAEALVALAGQLEGVDSMQVRAALSDHRHAAHVREELLAVVDAGAASNGLGTPATFVNGRLLAGAQPYANFEDAVERALQELPSARAHAVEASKQAYPMARVRHILVQFSEAREAHVKRSREEALAKAQLLRTQVTPSSFAQYASAESDCPSKQDGGELGRFTVGELEPTIELGLFALEPGQISEVIESPFGFHILLRED